MVLTCVLISCYQQNLDVSKCCTQASEIDLSAAKFNGLHVPQVIVLTVMLTLHESELRCPVGSRVEVLKIA